MVRGYKKEEVAVPAVRFVDNDRYRETGELYSLFQAKQELAGAFLLLYGDIIFEPSILERLLATRADVAVVVDRAFHDEQAAAPRVEQQADLLPVRKQGLDDEAAARAGERREGNLEPLGSRHGDPRLPFAQDRVQTDRAPRALEAIGVVRWRRLEIGRQKLDGARSGCRRP